MRERLEQILKIVCAALALLFLVQLVKVAIHLNPLSGVAVPELPSLPADTNAPPKVTRNRPAKFATDAERAAAIPKTNANVAAIDTNVVAASKPKGSESPEPPGRVATTPPGTNVLETNVFAEANSAKPGATNSMATSVTNAVGSTNVIAGLAKTNEAGKTNSALAKSAGPEHAGAMPPPTMGPGGGMAGGLTPDVQARVDRVTDSEILGPVIHPMPMALLGIAGKVAFLRSPSGQTGLVKEGEDLGEIKLLRIGVNRVLIEQDGQKKELMMFSGFGGESLLPKTTETSDETTKK
jgi:hypothetical protein